MKNKKIGWLGLICAAGTLSASAARYDFSSDSGQGIYCVENFSGTPVNGILATFPITLPPFERGAYFGGGLGSNFKWPRLANQMTPWFVHSNDMSTLFAEPFAKNPCKTIGKGAQSQGMFAFYRLESGEYLTLLTLSKGSTMSWLDTSKDGKLNLVLGNFGQGAESGDIPLLAWAKDRNLYRSLHQAWALALEQLNGQTDWRKGYGQKLDKPYAVELTGFSDRLLLLSPIDKGWAVIGACDKYLSPVAVESVEASWDKLTVTMVESGPLVIWCADGTPTAEGVSARNLGNGFWQFDLPEGKRDYAIQIYK